VIYFLKNLDISSDIPHLQMKPNVTSERANHKKYNGGADKWHPFLNK